MPKLKSAKYNLIVPVNLPALGFVTYNYFLKNTGDKISKNFKSKSASIEKFNYIENEVSVYFCLNVFGGTRQI